MPETKTSVLTIMLTAILALSGCHDGSDTLTGVAAPTPTPPPAVDLNGDWTGYFTTDDEADCHSGRIHASLIHAGDRVTGTFSNVPNSCGFGGVFEGTAHAGGLTGTLVNGSFGPGTVSGVVSTTEMHLHASDLRQPPLPDGSQSLVPGGHIELHR